MRSMGQYHLGRQDLCASIPHHTCESSDYVKPLLADLPELSASHARMLRFGGFGSGLLLSTLMIPLPTPQSSFPTQAPKKLCTSHPSHPGKVARCCGVAGLLVFMPLRCRAGQSTSLHQTPKPSHLDVRMSSLCRSTGFCWYSTC